MLNKDILREIASYIIKPKYKMIDWIKPYFDICINRENNKQNIWSYLSGNKKAHDFLFYNYRHKIDWNIISSNPNFIDELIKNDDKSNIEYMLCSPKMVNYYYNNQSLFNYYCFFKCPLAISHIENNVYKKLIFFSKKNEINEIFNYNFLLNINAYQIFEKYENEIIWNSFAKVYVYFYKIRILIFF